MSALEVLPARQRHELVHMCGGVAQVAEAGVCLVVRSRDRITTEPEAVLAAAEQLRARIVATTTAEGSR